MVSVLASGSTIGVFASTAMPDPFVGAGVLAAGLLLLWWHRLRPSAGSRFQSSWRGLVPPIPRTRR
ncbi:MAG: hypothetical protein N2038_13095 [Geminicoccaceae bacterium]|nr:hypothetical protein [Geminicoccaceae bacterium]